VLLCQGLNSSFDSLINVRISNYFYNLAIIFLEGIRFLLFASTKKSSNDSKLENVKKCEMNAHTLNRHTYAYSPPVSQSSTRISRVSSTKLKSRCCLHYVWNISCRKDVKETFEFTLKYWISPPSYGRHKCTFTSKCLFIYTKHTNIE
jgi:hypothetical protein